jgi:hypothetical protein
MEEDQRIKFLSTAYNYSFQKGYEEIDEMTDKKFFHTTLVRADTYSYADISLSWYSNYLENR